MAFLKTSGDDLCDIKNYATMNSATNYQVIVILFNTVLAKLNQTFGGLV